MFKHITIVIINITVIINKVAAWSFYQHGEDPREFVGKGKGKGDKSIGKGKSMDGKSIGKGKGDPPDDDEGEEEGEEEEEEEESDPVIIDRAYAAVQELETKVTNSEHKKVALEVFTTAT